MELEVDNQYIMSPKDLKTIHFMNKMLDAGVRVFKIEGRARGPEYVRTVVECYKEAIRSYLDDTFTDEKIQSWFLGRLLPGTTLGRMDQELRLCRYGT